MSSSSEEEDGEQLSSRAPRRVSSNGESKRKKRKKSKRSTDASSNVHQDENTNNNRHTAGKENRPNKKKKDIIINGIDDKNKTISVEEVNKICHRELRSNDSEIVEAALEKLENHHEYKVYELDGNLAADSLMEYVCNNHMISCITGSMFCFMDQIDILKAGLSFLWSFSHRISELPATIDSIIAAMDVTVQSMQKYPEDLHLNHKAFLFYDIYFCTAMVLYKMQQRT